MFGGGTAVYVGNFIECKMRVDDAVGAVAVDGYSRLPWDRDGWHLCHGIPDRHQQRPVVVRRSDDGSDGLPSAEIFARYIPAWILKKAGLLRVPLEVELEGLDIAEYGTDFYPEFEPREPEVVVLASGESHGALGGDAVRRAPEVLGGIRYDDA